MTRKRKLRADTPDITPRTVEAWIGLEMQDPKTAREVNRTLEQMRAEQDGQPMPPEQEVWPDGNLAEAEDNEGDAPLFPQGSPV